MFKSSNYRSLDKEWTNLFVTGVLLALQSIQDLRPENAMIKIYTVYIIFQKWTILKIFIPFQALFEVKVHDYKSPNKDQNYITCDVFQYLLA